MVAVSKPSGLLVHRSRESQDTQFLLQTLRDQIGQRVYPVHRLDRATSGIMVLGLNPESASQLGQQFERHAVSKHYLALIRGWPPRALCVGSSLHDEQRGWQFARTELQVLARVQMPFAVSRYRCCRVSLVRLTPNTGRRHQLRRHLKHLRHPILGDTTYGCRHHNQLIRQHLQQVRLFLHAEQLHLRHPIRQQSMRLRAPLDEDFVQAAGLFGWQL